MSLTGNELVAGIQQSLARCGVDYESIIAGFGQVRASEDRESGRAFTLQDHVRGLVFAQLSNQRPWKPIAENRDQISAVFLGFDPGKLSAADPTQLVSGLRALRCGNRSDSKQIAALAANIRTLRRMEAEFGSVDAFATSAEPERIAGLLSTTGPYKLLYVGPALALEYLKNVGIRASKPDVHVRRLLGKNRLGYSDTHPSEWEAYAIVERLALEAGRNATYLDNLLWLFCADGYGEICGNTPRCQQCSVAVSCRYPDRRSA